MSHPLLPSRLALRRKLVAVEAKVLELEALLFELNRHPDVTPELLHEAQQMYYRCSTRLREVRSQLEGSKA